MSVQPHNPGDDGFLKFLVHSPGGHGKTHFLGTAQEDERTYPMALINFDGGDLTLAGLEMDVYDARDMQDFTDIFEQLSDPDDPHRSVALDSVSETQVGGLMAILQEPSISKGGRPGPDTLEQSDWGTILVRMRRLIRELKWLPKHVFFTSLSKTDALPRIGQVLRPSLQGQFADDILGIPDVLAYMALDDVEVDEAHPDGQQRILLLHSNPRFMVKCRTPWGTTVPSEIEDPTVTKLLDALGYTK